MTKTKPTLLQILKIILGWPLSLLAIVFIVKFAIPKIDIVTTNITHVQPFMLLLGIGFFLLYFFFRTYLWQKILKAQGRHMDLRDVSYLWSVSELRRFIPGNVWALLSRTVLFSRRNIEKKTIFSSLILESQMIVAGTALVSLFSLPFLVFSFLPTTGFESLIMYTISAGIAEVILCYAAHDYILKKLHLKLPKFASFFLSQFHIKTNLMLLGISTVSFIFFSLGTYFTIASFVELPLHLFIQLLGFFAFSLLVGYISFITPMGIGVREGVITIGLAKLINLQTAGFASLFARIVLIVAELIFLGFAYVWHRSKSIRVLRTERFIEDHKHETILLASITAFCIYFTTASILRYTNFYTGRFDLGNMAQTVWNSSQGRLFQFTDPDGTQIISRLAFHADYILVLLAPFYEIWPNPKVLLLIQTVVVSAGAFFIYLLAQNIIKNKTLSTVLGVVYLFNPAVQYATLYDFHAVTLATTFLLGAYYFLIKRKYLLFIVFATLAALTKEQVWIIFAILGIFLIIKTLLENRSSKASNHKKTMIPFFIGTISVILSLGMFYYLIWHAIPDSRGESDHFALSYYSEFGDKPSAVIKNMVFSPVKTLGIMTQEDRLGYLYQLLLPLGYFSLLAPWIFLFIGPELGITLLSNNNQLHQIYFQYSATLTPFFFIAAIYGISVFKKFFPKISFQLVALYLLFTTCYAAYAFGPLPGAKNPNIDMFIKPQANKAVITAVLKTIPKNYSVAATNNLGAHLSHREKIFTIPNGMDQADVIAFLLDDPFAQPSPQAQRQMVVDLKQNKNYKIFYEKYEFIVFERIHK